MEQEEKSLLLKDLSARLPYGTIVSVTDGTIKYEAYIESVSYKNIQVSPISDSNFTAYTFYKISEIKPYLRPMSSMTKEELKTFYKIEDMEHPVIWNIPRPNWHFSVNGIDWLNAHHFDYRRLIEKGLALEAPKEMYEY